MTLALAVKFRVRSLKDSAIGRAVILMHVALLCVEHREAVCCKFRALLDVSVIEFTFAAVVFVQPKPMVTSVTIRAQDCKPLPGIDHSHRN